MGLLLFLFSYALGILSIKISGGIIFYIMIIVLYSYLFFGLSSEKYRFFIIHPLILAIISSIIIKFLGVVSLDNVKELLFMIVYLNLVLYVKSREEKSEKELKGIEIITEKILFPIFLPLSISFVALFLIQKEENVLLFFILAYFAAVTYMLHEKVTKIYGFIFFIAQVGLILYISTFIPGFTVKEIVFTFINISILIIKKQGRKMPLLSTRLKRT